MAKIRRSGRSPSLYRLFPRDIEDIINDSNSTKQNKIRDVIRCQDSKTHLCSQTVSRFVDSRKDNHAHAKAMRRHRKTPRLSNREGKPQLRCYPPHPCSSTSLPAPIPLTLVFFQVLRKSPYTQNMSGLRILVPVKRVIDYAVGSVPSKGMRPGEFTLPIAIACKRDQLPAVEDAIEKTDRCLVF